MSTRTKMPMKHSRKQRFEQWYTRPTGEGEEGLSAGGGRTSWGWFQPSPGGTVLSPAQDECPNLH